MQPAPVVKFHSKATLCIKALLDVMNLGLSHGLSYIFSISAFFSSTKKTNAEMSF